MELISFELLLVLIVTIFEFKGWNSLFQRSSFNPLTQPAPVRQEKVIMSTVTQMIKEHIAKNKVAVHAHSFISDFLTVSCIKIDFLKKLLPVSTCHVISFELNFIRYCAKAKRLFESLDQKFGAIEIDQAPQGTEIQAELATMTGQRTVPNIFINGNIFDESTTD
jgi:glutaredoxin